MPKCTVKHPNVEKLTCSVDGKHETENGADVHVGVAEKMEGKPTVNWAMKPHSKGPKCPTGQVLAWSKVVEKK